MVKKLIAVGAMAKQSEFNDSVGRRLRRLRQHYRWSLDRAAEASGVSKAMLGQIERGESSPTVATLWKISTGFEVPMSSLIEDSPLDGEVKRGQENRRLLLSEGEPEEWKPLFSYDPLTGIEVFVIDLPVGHEHLSPAHQEGVTEYIVVVSGELAINLTGQWQVLSAGEGIRFDASQAHGYRNNGQAVCSFHNVIHYQSSEGKD